MSKTAMVFFTLLLVIAGCVIAGCSSLPFSSTPAPTETPRKAVNVGLAGQDNSIVSQRVPFDEALALLSSPDKAMIWEDEPVNVTGENVSVGMALPEKHIKFIVGKNLDESGNAASWTFIIEHGGKVSIVTYNYQGMVLTNSPGEYKGTEVLTDQVIQPRALFGNNRAIIFDATRTGTSVSRDLTLGGGTYTVSVTGGGTPRILVFDATTGALISTND